VPYRVEQTGNTARIYIYDNNFPNSTSQYIEMNPAANRFTYTMSYKEQKIVWTGGKKRAKPIGVELARDNFTAKPEGMARSRRLGAQQTGQAEMPMSSVNISGNVTPQFTDSNGNKLGLVNGEMVSDIPGASYKIIVGYNPEFPDAVSPIIYELPTTENYKLQVQASENTTYTISAFGNGTATQLKDIQASAGSSDTVGLGADMREVTFATSSDKKYCFAFADDNLDDASRAMDLCTTTSAGGTATFKVGADSSNIQYLNNGEPATYTLTINQNGQGAMTQAYSGTVAANGEAVITVGGSGSKVYLPLIVK